MDISAALLDAVAGAVYTPSIQILSIAQETASTTNPTLAEIVVAGPEVACTRSIQILSAVEEIASVASIAIKATSGQSVSAVAASIELVSADMATAVATEVASAAVIQILSVAEEIDSITQASRTHTIVTAVVFNFYRLEVAFADLATVSVAISTATRATSAQSTSTVAATLELVSAVAAIAIKATSAVAVSLELVSAAEEIASITQASSTETIVAAVVFKFTGLEVVFAGLAIVSAGKVTTFAAVAAEVVCAAFDHTVATPSSWSATPYTIHKLVAHSSATVG